LYTSTLKALAEKKKIAALTKEEEQQKIDLTKSKANAVAAKKAIAENEGLSLSNVLKTIDKSKLDSAEGQALGIKANMSTANPVSYAVNAMYGEMSQQQSTAAKIATQGGVDSAVSTDVTEAGQKAAAQKGAVEGLQSEADKIGEKIGKSAASVMEETAKTMARGKIASDTASISRFDNDSEFVESQVKTASTKASTDKAKMDLDKNQANNNILSNKIIETAGKGYVGEEQTQKMQAAQDTLEKVGLIEKQKDGSFQAATGTNFSNAMATLGAGDMGRDKQVQVNGTSMNIDRGVDGQTRVTATSKENVERGEGLDYSVSGYAGSVGVGLAIGVGAVGAANQYSKHMASEKIPMKMEDMQGAKSDGKGGFVDSKGNGFSLNGQGEVTRDGKVAMKDNPNYKKGYVKAKWDDILNTATNKYDDLVGGESPSKTSNGSPDSTNKVGDNTTTNNNANESSQGNKNNVTQGTPPDVKSETSIPKNDGSVKTSISSEIDAQYKKMGILNNDAGYVREADAKTAQYKEQVRLNGSATPEMASRYASDMANIQDSNLKRIESFKSPKSPQSMFSKINDFFGGSNGAKSRLGTFTTLAAATYALSATSAEASSMPNDKPVLTGGQEALLAGSNITGAAEMGVGLTTLGASMATGAPVIGTVATGIAKFGARITPGLGLAYGAADGAYRTSQGDYLGASMSAGIAAASTVPGLGTGLAVAGGFAQMATDAFGITGGSQSPAPAHAQKAFSSTAGINTGIAMQNDSNAGNITMLSSSTPAPFAQTSGGGGGSSPIVMPTIDTSSISTSLVNVLSTFSSASMVSTATQGMTPQSGDMMSTGKNI
jgi:hypothetical protein